MSKGPRKTFLKPFLTIVSPWRSARTAIMGNTMENLYFEKISLKNHFLMEFWQIWDHFIIVIWQKYLLFGGLRIGFLWPEVPVLAYPNFWKISVFNANLKSYGRPKKGLSVQKSPILRPLYNRYFCHITIIKWSRICRNSTRKCFFGDIFSTYPFSIIFPNYSCSSTTPRWRTAQKWFPKWFSWTLWHSS